MVVQRLRQPRKRLIAVFGSNAFFWTIVVLCALQAVWVAFSSHYPMAFDEDYHLGLIRFYSHHLSPFLSSQPTTADVYGALYRDPSYLYHYLMSFPYRWLTHLTHDQTLQVLILRFINIGLFTASLPVFRRLLQKLGGGAGAINCVLLLFVLIPVVPLLAAQINYDNLFIPLVALFMLWLVQFIDELRTFQRCNTGKLLSLTTLAAVGCLVKYAFLPLAATAAVFIAYQLVRTYRRPRRLLLSIVFGFTLLDRIGRWLRLALLLIILGLFAQRYGVNIVRYHNPLPNCSHILSVKRCSAYGPWIRDYTLSQQKSDISHTPYGYLGEWLYGMWLRLFFAVDGPATLNETRGPLFLPGVGAIIFGVVSVFLCLRYQAQLRARYPQFLAPLLLAGIYMLVLWLDGYAAYERTGQPVAINGRYLLPILPVLMLLGALAWRYATLRRFRLRIGMAALAITCLLWGGGVLTFILRTDDYWYWPNHSIGRVNNDLRNWLGPVTPGYTHPTEFLR